MRIDGLPTTSLYLPGHRIQPPREVIHALVDLEKAEAEAERSGGQLNAMSSRPAIEHSIC